MKIPEPYEAVVLADSSAGGVRLTTLCCTFPRIVLAEFNTHRMFSRNSASSRAIPVKKRIAQIRENPYVPLSFGKNQRGMQAKREEVRAAEDARYNWMNACHDACSHAEVLAKLGLHKQWANRLIEPFAWHTVIVSATEWANFFALRISEYAQPEIKEVAEAMKAAMDASEPRHLAPGQWHLPLIGHADGDVAVELDEARPTSTLVKLSVARCAAVSYERHMEQNIEKDLARYDKLFEAKHMSPFEHAAQVGKLVTGGYMTSDGQLFEGDFIGNFRAPWIQHRKMLAGEAVWDA